MNIRLDDQYELRDGVLIQIQRTAVRKVRFEDLIRTAMALTKESDYRHSPMLPGGDLSCRMFVENKTSIGFLMQMNPGVKTIRYKPKRESSGKYRKDPDDPGCYLFDVSLPWTWMLVRLWKVDDKYQWSSCWACSTYRNIETVTDRVWHSPMPNIHPLGMICTGDIMKDMMGTTDKPALLCKTWMYRSLQAMYNEDLASHLPKTVLNGSRIDCLGKWEELTRANPSVALSEDFGLTPYSGRKDALDGSADGTLDAFLRTAMGASRT